MEDGRKHSLEGGGDDLQVLNVSGASSTDRPGGAAGMSLSMSARMLDGEGSDGVRGANSTASASMRMALSATRARAWVTEVELLHLPLLAHACRSRRHGGAVVLGHVRLEPSGMSLARSSSRPSHMAGDDEVRGAG